jgi:hypothetical protein
VLFVPWAVVLALAVRFGRKVGRGSMALVISAALVVPVAAEWQAARERLRYRYYSLAGQDRTYSPHDLGGLARSWPVWQALDVSRPLVIAVAAGWDGVGHNWFRYPLLGSRLQNRLCYVPVSSDCSVRDYRVLEAKERPDTSVVTWLHGLAASEANCVVLLPPRPVAEDSWVRQLPAVFTELSRGTDGEAAAWLVNHTALSEHLASVAALPTRD